MTKALATFLTTIAVASAFCFSSVSADEINNDYAVIKFNPTGTHIKDNRLKIRFDIYPASDFKSYNLYYHTKTKTLAPMLIHFITIDKTTTRDEVINYLNLIFTCENLRTIDEALVSANSIHLLEPFLKDKSVLSNEETKLLPYLLKDINDKFFNLELVYDQNSKLHQNLTAMSIDIGNNAIDRSVYGNKAYTEIDLGNASNGTGTISVVQSYWYAYGGQPTDVAFGTFYLDNGTIYTCRDSEYVGFLFQDLLQTTSGLDIDVNFGDFIGKYSSNGKIEYDVSGFTGTMTSSGDHTAIGATSSYTYFADDGFSVYGTGEESGEEETNWTDYLTDVLIQYVFFSFFIGSITTFILSFNIILRV